MTKVGVYKTDVTNSTTAEAIIVAIHRQLPGCEASFDLEDCDNVLRVENVTNGIEETRIRNILQYYGHQIETLP